MHASYRAFYIGIPFYGTAVTCIDHPVVRRMLRDIADDMTAKVLTYGLAEDADLRLRNVRADGPATVFDAELSPRVPGGQRVMLGIRMPVPGEHNALNALAAIAVAAQAGIDDPVIRAAIADFSGVKRRFTATGTWNGVSFFDDYAHHPVEIEAVLKAARTATSGRVIGIFQPHRYSRVASLFDDFARAFADADAVIVTPIYSAGEKPLAGIDHASVAEAIRKTGHAQVVLADSEHDLAPLVATLARPGDLVIGLGAGTITEWVHALPEWLGSARRAAGGGL